VKRSAFAGWIALALACSTKSTTRNVGDPDAGKDAAPAGGASGSGTGGSAATGGSSGGTGGSGGSSTGGTGGSAGTGGATSGLDCAAFAKTQCQRMQACSPYLLATSFGDSAQCETALTSSCTKNQAAPGADATQGAGCIDALEAVACEDLFGNSFPDACRLQGSLAIGSACGSDWQCASGVCNFDSSQCGQCADPVPENGDCTTNKRCAHGLNCNTSNRCVRPGRRNDPCATASPCVLAFACIEGVCSDPLPSASACDPAALSCNLLAGGNCLPDLATGDNFCRETILSEPGSMCGFFNGTIYQCKGDAMCTGGFCEPRPKAGQACDPQMPLCVQPATCQGTQCVIVDPASCN
jgi:hypothetical protein